ncbi:MAG TPA: GAF domain-containing protein [Thermoanaerobaculia bacterium]
MSNESGLPSYVDRVREDTQKYIRHLMAENEQLRVAGAQLESETARLRQELAAVRQELVQHREAEHELAQTMERIRTEGEQYLARYAEVEMHNANLANLYVTSYQLHGTLKREAILQSLQEVIVNLIGSEDFAICETEDGALTVAASVGVEPATVTWATPHVRTAAESRILYIGPADREPGDPLVCLPLQVDGQLVGMVIIFNLLAHKAQLEPLDHELFDLLASHASTALYCCALQQRLQEAVPAS